MTVADLQDVIRDEGNGTRRVPCEVRQQPAIAYAVHALFFLVILWHPSFAQKETQLLGVP